MTVDKNTLRVGDVVVMHSDEGLDIPVSALGQQGVVVMVWSFDDRERNSDSYDVRLEDGTVFNCEYYHVDSIVHRPKP